MPQIMSDGSVRHYFKIRGRDYPVETGAKDNLNEQDFQHIAATLYALLQQDDLLLSEIQPFRGQYAPLASCLKQLMLRDITTVQRRIRQHFGSHAGVRTSVIPLKLTSEWRWHSRNEQRGRDSLNHLRQVLDGNDELALSTGFRTYRERWRRQILVWMLLSWNDSYANMVERYLRGDSDRFYDAWWWDVPPHTYSRIEWETLGYKPCVPPTIKYWSADKPPTIMYTYWQVAPVKGKAEARQAFWMDQVIQTIPAIAAAFVSAHPPAERSDYDALIYDMACVLSGEFGHQYYDWWGKPIPIAYGHNIVKMNFAQEVYRLCEWDFNEYPYYEFAR